MGHDSDGFGVPGDWTEGYDVDPQTNCKDTCDKYEDYRLLMLAKGIEVVS